MLAFTIKFDIKSMVALYRTDLAKILVLKWAKYIQLKEVSKFGMELRTLDRK